MRRSVSPARNSTLVDEADGICGEGSGSALRERSDIDQRPPLPLFATHGDGARVGRKSMRESLRLFRLKGLTPIVTPITRFRGSVDLVRGKKDNVGV